MYKAHYSAMRNAANTIVSDEDASHDIVQEVFLKLWHRREDLSFILNPRTYLLRAVVNASITYLNKNKNKVRLSNLNTEATVSSESNLDLKALEQTLQTALNKLPARCKAIFVLSRFEGTKNKEIARLLGISVKTVENQMGIALKKLRDDLSPFYNSEFITTALGAGLSILLRFLVSFLLIVFPYCIFKY
jgi:RNA polymerase sigma-70 factor (ECF subfamily)